MKKAENFKKGTIGIDGSHLEQTWQKEFYRIGTQVLDPHHFLLYDVGAVCGCKGFIDFYVDGKDWVIEMVRIWLNIIKGLNFTGNMKRLSNMRRVYPLLMFAANRKRFESCRMISYMCHTPKIIVHLR